MRPLSRGERRVVAISPLVILVGVLHALVVGPLAQGFSARANQRQMLSLQLQRNAATIASIEPLRRQLVRARSQAASFAIVAPSPAAGRARLVQRLQSTVETSGGDVRDGDPAQAPAGWVGARVTARMTLAQAAQALARLQNEQPAATIEEVTIAVDAAGRSGTPDALEISIETAVPILAAAPR